MDNPKASSPDPFHSAPSNEVEKHLALARSFIEHHPDHPLGWKALGFALLRANKPNEATSALERVLELGSDEVEVYDALGLALTCQGHLEPALDIYAKLLAIKPDYANGHDNMGTVLHGLGRLNEALACHTRAVKISPDHALAYNNMGSVLQDLGRLNEAWASCATALGIKSDLAEAHNNMGNILLAMGRPEQARASYARALEILPDNAEVHNNMGSTLRQLDRLDDALASCRKALEIKPDYAQALNNLGTILKDLDRMDDALECWAKALRSKPDYAVAHNNMATALSEQGRFEEALKSYVEALKYKPDDADIRSNYALAQLAAGNFQDGWREYENRFDIKKLKRPKRDFNAPRWKGQPLPGKTLLIHAEQGFGDTLQFCRYATLAAQRGARVVMEVQAPVLRLLGCLAGVSDLAAQGGPVPACDLHIPMLSLPGVFGTNIDNIPCPEGYLRAQEPDVAAWRLKLAHIPSAFKRVGLAWSGGIRNHPYEIRMRDKRRSINPAILFPLFQAPGIHFVSLQKDGPKAPKDYPLFDPMDDCRDFADTAGLIMNLDLVISVDTAVAHLAGALGKPVWLLNRFDSCWRWQRERPCTPWYRSMRIFHQKSRGHWAEVIERVKNSLAFLAIERPGA